MIKIVKIILEKKDIEELILKKYPGATIKSGLKEDMEILITLTEFKQEIAKSTTTITPEVARVPEVHPPLPKARGVMDRTRGNMPTF